MGQPKKAGAGPRRRRNFAAPGPAGRPRLKACVQRAVPERLEFGSSRSPAATSCSNTFTYSCRRRRRRARPIKPSGGRVEPVRVCHCARKPAVASGRSDVDRLLCTAPAACKVKTPSRRKMGRPRIRLNTRARPTFPQTQRQPSRQQGTSARAANASPGSHILRWRNLKLFGAQN